MGLGFVSLRQDLRHCSRNSVLSFTMNRISSLRLTILPVILSVDSHYDFNFQVLNCPHVSRFVCVLEFWIRNNCRTTETLLAIGLSPVYMYGNRVFYE